MKIFYKKKELGELSGGDLRHLKKTLKNERVRYNDDSLVIQTKKGLEIAQREFWELS